MANEKDKDTEPHPQSQFSPDKGVDLEPYPAAGPQLEQPPTAEPQPPVVLPGGGTRRGN